MRSPSSYRLVRSRSIASEFHARTVPNPATCEIWQHDITAPALVLGSTQDESTVDADACRRAGVEVVRRRSGGGAVLLRPGEVIWVDVIVPAGSAGWSDDVHGPMVWLGRHVQRALEALLEPDVELAIHDGALRSTPWSSLICFDGVGAGEVLLDGRKLVGISQRRTRHAARLQCCWYSTYDPAELVGLLSPSVRPSVDQLMAVATLAPDLAEAGVTALAQRLA